MAGADLQASAPVSPAQTPVLCWGSTLGAMGLALKAPCVRASLSWHLDASWVEEEEEDWLR